MILQCYKEVHIETSWVISYNSDICLKEMIYSAKVGWFPCTPLLQYHPKNMTELSIYN